MKLIVDTGGNEGRSSPMSETASASYSSLEDRLSSTDSVSCITNNGVATVRIENMPTEPTDKEYHTLRYPANSKVGIQFHPMQSVRHDIKTNKQRRLFPLQRFVSKPQLLLDDDDRPKERQKAFLVCGHLGFDDSSNTAPPLGSVLAAVNGKELGTNAISLSEIRETVRQGLPFTLSFKLEPLGRKEEKRLAKAVRAVNGLVQISRYLDHV
eukprot:CAMPEP_0194224830 /NCGR_PEP_ID=MMETSP0156-20130528/38266_1 /TAXON_ID=33649 /ORGANISM="Thalassionema nitzschioides, Strain L26-B" /LENGTH=210 /DNA_ID=CAMNT_0038956549 /DNA_START=63 /DNA_END=695 /DNA_ORIENTATION=-